MHQIKKLKQLAVVVWSVLAVLIWAFTVQAQSVTTIYSFTNGPANPYAGLTLGPDGNFYGTTLGGGAYGLGTVFEVTTNSTLTTLVNFNSTNGANPYSGLTLGPDGNFYGTTFYGGFGVGEFSKGNGTVFKVTTNGTLTTLVYFNVTNGANSQASLTLGPDGEFYGTTEWGGSNAYGTIFKVTVDGTLTSLISFDISSARYPGLALTLGTDGNLYGTTYHGGSEGDGMVFKMTTNGTLTSLVTFNSTNGVADFVAPLTLGQDGNFYGTTEGGPGSGNGIVFKVTTNGTLTTLVNFNNTNGANPYASLTLGPDGNFYGTTEFGGSTNIGTVFRMTTDGALTTLVNFNNVNGAYPTASLTLGTDGNFYGTTYAGGSEGLGTVFQLELPPDFITAPTNQSAVIGSKATFTCQPFGTAPFTYQWLSNGVAISGATASSLTVNNVSFQTASNAQFQVVVSNSWGSITSNPAMIDIALGIVDQPADQTVLIGHPVTYSASVAGYMPIQCQWYSMGPPPSKLPGILLGATNTTLSLSRTTAFPLEGYFLVANNSYGSVTSRVAALNLLLQPNIYAVSNSGGKLTLYFGTYPNSTNRVWASTNLAFNQWHVIATNVINAYGLGQFTETNISSLPQQLFRLSDP